MNPQLNPKDFLRVGKWPNGTYFNALDFQAENRENYRQELGIELAPDPALMIDDEFFLPKTWHDAFVTEVEKDSMSFWKGWNEGCEQAMKRVQKYVDSQKSEDYPHYSIEQLIHAVEEFQRVLGRLLVYLFSYPNVAEAVERYVLTQKPDLSFNEVRPLRKISAETINEAVLTLKENDEEGWLKLARDYGWYGLTLLRGQSLSVADFKELRSTATLSASVAESADPVLRELQLFLWLKFERIDVINYALYRAMPLFSEVLRRITCDSRYWEVLLPDEIVRALKTDEVPKDLDDRFTYRGIVKQNSVVRHLSRSEFEDYKRLFVDAPISAEAPRELKGVVACAGKITGTVVVVRNNKDITKVKPGDILVASETLVQYEPYMKKALGMIIEMGGLLSHSAIFAREFKIPTIVGVANATKILRDGDTVELDAEKGIVRILT